MNTHHPPVRNVRYLEQDYRWYNFLLKCRCKVFLFWNCSKRLFRILLGHCLLLSTWIKILWTNLIQLYLLIGRMDQKLNSAGLYKPVINQMYLLRSNILILILKSIKIQSHCSQFIKTLWAKLHPTLKLCQNYMYYFPQKLGKYIIYLTNFQNLYQC